MCDKIYKLTEFSPFISTENQGDMIIKLNCEKVFDEVFPCSMKAYVLTREHLSKTSMKTFINGSINFELFLQLTACLAADNRFGGCE